MRQADSFSLHTSTRSGFGVGGNIPIDATITLEFLPTVSRTSRASLVCEGSPKPTTRFVFPLRTAASFSPPSPSSNPSESSSPRSSVSESSQNTHAVPLSLRARPDRRLVVRGRTTWDGEPLPAPPSSHLDLELTHFLRFAQALPVHHPRLHHPRHLRRSVPALQFPGVP